MQKGGTGPRPPAPQPLAMAPGQMGGRSWAERRWIWGPTPSHSAVVISTASPFPLLSPKGQPMVSLQGPPTATRAIVHCGVTAAVQETPAGTRSLQPCPPACPSPSQRVPTMAGGQLHHSRVSPGPSRASRNDQHGEGDGGDQGFCLCKGTDAGSCRRQDERATPPKSTVPAELQWRGVHRAHRGAPQTPHPQHLCPGCILREKPGGTQA